MIRKFSSGILSLRRVLRFRLRAALLLILFCAIAFAWARHRLDSYRHQHQALQSLRQHPHEIKMRDGHPAWLTRFAAPNTFSDIIHLSWQQQQDFSDHQLATIGRLPRLVSLSLEGTGITDDGLRHLAHLTELESLSLESTAITDRGIAELSGLKNLRSLRLGDSRITHACVPILAEMEQLEVLAINHVELDDEDLHQMARLQRLTEFAFCARRLTPDGFADLSRIKTLRSINLTAPLPTAIELNAMPNLRSLWVTSAEDAGELHLSLHNLPILDELLIDAGRIDDLSTSGLPRVWMLTLHKSQIDDRVFQQLEAVVGLRHLSLAGSRYSASAVTHLSTLSQLMRLDVTDGMITDVDVQYLSRLTQLQSLDLTANPIVGDGLANLATMPNLKWLNVSAKQTFFPLLPTSRGLREVTARTQVRNNVFSPPVALERLAELKSLQVLTITGFRITKEELQLLGGLNNLKSLNVDTIGLVDGEFEEVAKVLPIVQAPISQRPIGTLQLGP